MMADSSWLEGHSVCAAQPMKIAEKKAKEGAHTHEQHSKQENQEIADLKRSCIDLQPA
jgi:hypothetical protein